MIDLSSLNLELLILYLLSIAIFFILGMFFSPKVNNRYLQIGVQFLLGFLFFVTIISVLTVGYKTMMFPFLGMYGFLFFKKMKNKITFNFKLSYQEVFFILIFSLIIYFIHALNCNLELGESILIGNTDFSFYSYQGHNFYTSSNESLFFDQIKYLENPSSFYHNTDLWISGFYSFYFNIIPYYSYFILYSSLSLLALFLILFGWAKANFNNKYISFLFVILCVFGTNIILPFELPRSNYSILELFNIGIPLYTCKPYILMASTIVMFLALFQAESKKWIILFLPFASLLNPGIALILPIAYLLLLSLSLLSKKFRFLQNMGFNKKMLIIAFFISLIPYVVYGKGGVSDGSVESQNLLYLIFHTSLRTTFSLVFALPFLYGLSFFYKNNSNFFYLLLTSLVGLIFSFSAAYTIVGGNSVQIYYMFILSFIIPTGLFGLFKYIIHYQTNIKLVSQAILTTTTILILYHTIQMNFYAIHYDWTKLYSGKKQTDFLKSNKWEKNLFYEFIYDLSQHSKVAFIADTNINGGVIHYDHFTYLGGVLPNTHFYRINKLLSDDNLSNEMSKSFNLSKLKSYTDKFDNNTAMNKYLKEINPSVIITSESDSLIFPLNTLCIRQIKKYKFYRAYYLCEE